MMLKLATGVVWLPPRIVTRKTINFPVGRHANHPMPHPHPYRHLVCVALGGWIGGSPPPRGKCREWMEGDDHLRHFPLLISPRLILTAHFFPLSPGATPPFLLVAFCRTRPYFFLPIHFAFLFFISSFSSPPFPHLRGFPLAHFREGNCHKGNLKRCRKQNIHPQIL